MIINHTIDKVVNWRQPSTGRELVVFLGFTNYYREFLPDFAKMTAGLNAVKAKTIIEWNTNLVYCFNAVETMFTQAPCQTSPNFFVHSKPFILTIDFSIYLRNSTGKKGF